MGRCKTVDEKRPKGGPRGRKRPTGRQFLAQPVRAGSACTQRGERPPWRGTFDGEFKAIWGIA